MKTAIKRVLKIMISNTKILAALLMTGAAFTACSDKDEMISEQPVNPVQQTYKMTVDASMGDGAQTRALYFDGSALKVKWYNTDQVSVFPAAWSRTAYGTLTAAASDNGSTTLTGDLTTLPAVNDNLKLLFPRTTWDYTGQTGVLLTDANSIEKKYDYALADVTVNSVSGNAIATTKANFASQQAIVKFTLQDQCGNAFNASRLTISAASGKLVTGIGYVVPSRHTGGYTYDAGTNGDASEPASNLVDGNTATKWCVGNGNKSDGIWYCEFHTTSAVLVEGYTLTTGDDNESEHNRNPKDWVLKAKVNSSDEWTTIATVTNENTMEDVNFTPYDFDVDTPGEYQYFRFEISATRGADVMQLCELQLFKKTYGTAYGNLTVIPSSAASELTVALRNENASADTYSLVATYGATTSTYSKSGVTFENGKYYTVTVKMAQTVTWNSSNCNSPNFGTIYHSNPPRTIDGITLKCNAEASYATWKDSEGGIEFHATLAGGFTFTAPSGKKFTKIEMTAKDIEGGWPAAINAGYLGTGWPSGGVAMDEFTSSKKITWTGDAASVDLFKDATFTSSNYDIITNIVFYLAKE